MKNRAYRADLGRRIKRAGVSLIALGAVVALPTVAPAQVLDAGDLAVSSMVRGDYVRTRSAGGAFQPETYVVGHGGPWTTCIVDNSIDKLGFMDVTHVAAMALAKQNYVPAKDPAQAQLWIKIFWGTTGGIDDPPAEWKERRNALLMGYEGVLTKNAEDEAGRGGALNIHFHSAELMKEFRGGAFGRYFVVLIAYDYQLWRQQHQEKPLWITRFSIPGRGYAFNEALPAMTLAASRYFGKPTNGLTHADLREGTVGIGELKVIGFEPEKK